MSRFKAFNLVFLTLFGLFVLAILLMGLYMQPLRGDLTRLGGYLENEYGWNEGQETFDNALFRPARSVEDYDRYFDVVVLGDSFSENKERGWQNYLASRTGWSIITLNMNSVPLQDVITTDVYQSSPPRLFIYQSVERNMITRNETCTGQFNEDTPFQPILVPEIRSTDLAVELVSRDRGPLLLESGPSPVINYWRKAFARNVLNSDSTEVHRSRISRPHLFSNIESEYILLFTNDLKLRGVTDDQIAIAQCNLLATQQLIRARGTTEFVVLMFPDKSSLYSNYLTKDEYRNMSIAAKLEATPGLNIARLKDRFDEEVTSGTIDFYLPNDTHCGYKGYSIAADAVLRVLCSLDHSGSCWNSMKSL